MWRRLRQWFAATYRGIRDTLADLRESVTTTVSQSWATTHDWTLEVTSGARLFQAYGRWEILSAALTLALAALLFGPYLLVRAIVRHIAAYGRRPDLPALWYGMLVYELCWAALGAATLVWQGAVINPVIGVGLLATIVWLVWSHMTLSYYDMFLRPERSPRSVVTGILREAWWNNL